MTSATSFLSSLPERTVRATAALGGGLISETSGILLPPLVRDSRLYQATIGRLLRIVVELVGGVGEVYEADAMPVQELAVRKAAGNVIELAGVLTAGWSPLWLLAAAADITGGTRVYLRAFVDELRTNGVLPDGLEIESVEELLTALEGTSALMADAVDVPPLNVAAMRSSWQALRAQAGALPEAADLARLYHDLVALSRREGLPLTIVAETVAAGALRAGARLGDAHVINYYRDTLDALVAEGLPAYLRRSARPYLRGAARHFDPRATTFTQRFLRG